MIPVNWRKAKKMFKKSIWKTRRGKVNGSNKSVRTWLRMGGRIPSPG